MVRPTTLLTEPLCPNTRPQIVHPDELIRGLIHGDHYPRNILCYDGAIAGVIDWMEMGHAPPRARAWLGDMGVSQTDAGDDLDVERARRFLRAYRAEGGPVPPEEDRHAVLFQIAFPYDEGDVTKSGWILATVGDRFSPPDDDTLGRLRGVNEAFHPTLSPGIASMLGLPSATVLAAPDAEPACV